MKEGMRTSRRVGKDKEQNWTSEFVNYFLEVNNLLIDRYRDRVMIKLVLTEAGLFH